MASSRSQSPPIPRRSAPDVPFVGRAERPRRAAGNMLDQILCIVFLFWASHAWVYAGDFQTQVDTTAPGLFPFGIAAQLIGLYGLIRLRVTQAMRLSVADPFVLVLLAWGGASIAWSTDPYNSFGMLRTMLLLLFGCMYFSQALTNEELHRSVRLCLLGITVGSILLALLTPYGSAAGVHLGVWRGMFGHKTGLGEVSAIGMLVSAGSMLASRRRDRLDMALLGTSLICCAFSGSANSVGATVIGLGITIAATTSRRLSRFYILNRTAFFVVMIGAAILMFVGIQLALSALGRDVTFTGRTKIWEVYLMLAQNRPIFGWGWTTSSSNLMFIQVLRDMTGLKYIRSTHSAYVQQIVELGYVGLGLWITWLVAATVSALGAVTRARDPMATVVVAVVLGMASFGGFEVSAGFLPSVWLFIALAYGYAFKTQQRAPAPRAGPRPLRVSLPGDGPRRSVAAKSDA